MRPDLAGDLDGADVRRLLEDPRGRQRDRSAVRVVVDLAVGDLDLVRQPELHLRVDDPRGQRRREGHDLERRPRLVHVLHGPVARQLVQLPGRQVVHLVVVVGRRRAHGEHLAGARIEHDGRGRLRLPPPDGVLEDALHLRLDDLVDRQLHVAAVLRLGQLQLLQRLPVRRVDLQLTARLAGQPRVEAVFQPGAVGPAVEVDVGVAEQLRGEVAERVDAVRLGHGEQAGRVRRQDVVDGRRVELAHQLHLVGVGLQQPAQPSDLGAPLLPALDAEPVGDVGGGDVGVDHLLRVRHQRLPRHLLRQLVAVAVGDRAPRHGDVVHVALLRVGPRGRARGRRSSGS